MMISPSYYDGAGNDMFYRDSPSGHRHISTAAYYDRQVPYHYYEQPRQDHRSEYPGRPTTRAMIHEPEPEAANEQPRRRIAVACSRCRRRKIKCSGDPGDNSGCAACKASGADVRDCIFNRVGSQAMHMPGVEVYPQVTSISGPAQTASYSVDNGYGGGGAYQPHTRASLPTLHTRGGYQAEYDPHFDSSPVDAYTYSTSSFPRQDSFASSYGIENYRSWSTTAPMSAPLTTSYYESQPTYSFGSLQAPAYPHTQATRVPSVTAEGISTLNMGHLNSALPAQTFNERRLPIPAPYTLQMSPGPYSNAEVPQIHPLTSYNTKPRVHINGIHSRSAMPWSRDVAASGGSRNGSIMSLVPSMNMTQSTSQSTSTAVSEPVLGYQFGLAAPVTATNSPEEVSPTCGPSISEGFASTTTSSMQPPMRYSSSTMPPILSDDHTTGSSSRGLAPVASLYSFSTDTSDRQTSDSDHDLMDHSGSYQTTMRHPQPQHAASVDSLNRQTSFDQSHGASGAHRMSMSNLSSRY